MKSDNLQRNNLISVIVPIYNVEKYLNRCIESIVNQTYKNLEIILVDDESPDNCPQICDAWSEKDNRIKVIHKQNGGLSDARNAGFEIATGEYISFIDSDDWIELDLYETLANALDNGADIACCSARLCDEENNTLSVCGLDKEDSFDGITATQMLLKEQGIMQTVWNKLYKRECIANIKFPFGKYHEDNFWTWQIFLNSKTVFVTDKPMYNYVQRGNSIMSSMFSLKRLDALEANYIVYESLVDDERFTKIVFNKELNTCFYLMQEAMKHLKGDEKQTALNTIMDYYNKINVKKYKSMIESSWVRLFVIAPKLVVRFKLLISK